MDYEKLYADFSKLHSSEMDVRLAPPKDAYETVLYLLRNAGLSPNQHNAICYRYGVIDGVSRTYKETAALMCNSASASRTLVIKGLRKFKSDKCFGVLMRGVSEKKSVV